MAPCSLALSQQFCDRDNFNVAVERFVYVGRDCVREFISQGKSIRVEIVVGLKNQANAIPFALGVGMPWPTRKFFCNVTGHLLGNVWRNACAS